MTQTNQTTAYEYQEEDTVMGRLNKTADFNSPVARRLASEARRTSTSRGLSNSSISVGSALGKMLDHSVDIAKTDSTNIINSKIQNAINATSMRNTDESNATSRANTQLTTDTQKQIAEAQDKAAGERLAAQIESNEKINQDKIDFETLNMNTQAELTREGYAHDVSINDARIEADKYIARLNAQSNQAARTQSADTTRVTNAMSARDAAYATYQQQVANIDPNASPASQQEQLARITEAYDLRVEAIDNEELDQLVSAKSVDATHSEAYRAYQLAKQTGKSAAELDAIAGAPEGTAEAYIEKMGWDAL